MAKVASRSYGGLPKPQRPVNPFDSDDDLTTTSAPSSTRYSNPFDDDSYPHGRTTSRTASDPQGLKSSNPFDDEYPHVKSSKSFGKGNKIKPSINSRDTSNPFDDNFQEVSKPESRGDRTLDDGSLFDDDEMPAKPAKERKSRARSFASKIAEGGSRLKEGAMSAANSLSYAKLPSMSSGSSASKGYDELSSSKRGKAKNESGELLAEPEPVYKNYISQQDQVTLENQTVKELEQYAVKASQDTTTSIKNAIKIATDTQEIAKTTLETLDHQGKQIRQTHETALHVNDELGRGEKLLGSLGGIFSKGWKPKKAHKITGPQVDSDQYKRRNHPGERDALGFSGAAAARSRSELSGVSSAQAQLAMEKNTQDEALSDLSNVLGQIKGMTLEMGNEIDRQNGDLGRMEDDVQELNARVKGANNRTRHLLGR